MLKKANIKFSQREKSELRNAEVVKTAGEIVRDKMIEAGVKAVEESAYTAGNKTENILEIAEKAKDIIDGGIKLVGGTEASSALGRIGFKATKDIARGDKICTGLCLVSGACETVALGCSTIKIIPFRGQIYIGAKIVSSGCIAFRNACAGEGC
jgi:phage-related tail protein